MRSNNPVFNRAEGFSARNAQGNVTYPGNGQGYAGYGSPSTWSTGAGTPTSAPSGYGVDTRDQGRMTIDSVVQKTGVTLGLLVLAAAVTWVLTGDPTVSQTALSQLSALLLVSGLVGAGLGIYGTGSRRLVKPAVVIAYAVIEGVFIGAASKLFQTSFGDGVVTGAVIGTIAAFGGTLAAYKVLDIKVGDKFRRGVVAAGFGFMALVLLDFVLSFFHAEIGFNGFGTLGLVMSVVGLGLGILYLILDFDFVERGIAVGLPEQESWRAALGLTVTIVFIYINLLRILAILSRN